MCLLLTSDSVVMASRGSISKVIKEKTRRE